MSKLQKIALVTLTAASVFTMNSMAMAGESCVIKGGKDPSLPVRYYPGKPASSGCDGGEGTHCSTSPAVPASAGGGGVVPCLPKSVIDNGQRKVENGTTWLLKPDGQWINFDTYPYDYVDTGSGDNGAQDAQQNARLDAHDVDLTDIKNKNKQQDDRLSGHDVDITNIKDVNNKQNERLDAHDVDLTDIKNKNKEQDTRLNGHDIDITNIKDVNNKQNERLDAHDVDLTDIKNKNKEQDTRLNGHDVDITNIKDVNNKQNERLDGHDKNIAYLEEQDRLAVKYIPDANGAPTNVVKLTGDGSGAPVTITNVNAGVKDLDAVNKKQLDGILAGVGGGAHVDNKGNVIGPTYNINNHSYNDVGSALSATNVRIDQLANNNNARFDALDKRVTDVRKEARAGIAGASALAGMRYDDRAGKLSLASGFGGFQDAQAMSLGVGYTTEDGVFRLNAGASYDFQGQGTAWNMGLGWTLN